jgi:hypothetical protein
MGRPSRHRLGLWIDRGGLVGFVAGIPVGVVLGWGDPARAVVCGGLVGLADGGAGFVVGGLVEVVRVTWRHYREPPDLPPDGPEADYGDLLRRTPRAPEPNGRSLTTSPTEHLEHD